MMVHLTENTQVVRNVDRVIVKSSLRNFEVKEETNKKKEHEMRTYGVGCFNVFHENLSFNKTEKTKHDEN